MAGIGNQPVKQLGIGVIGEAISSGLDRCAGIQVTVGKRLTAACQSGPARRLEHRWID
jgi:hypothetical protein